MIEEKFKKHLQHTRSSVEGKKPTADNLLFGEIAVNYNADNEFLAIKNSEGEIVTFPRNIGSAQIRESVDEEAKQGIVALDDFLDSGFTSVNPVTNRVLSKTIMENEEVVAAALNDLNMRIDESYQKPLAGIPKSDLDLSIQESLSKADTALQGETDPIFMASAAQGISNEDIDNWNGKYEKGTNGIPKSDLAQDVQASLDKADSSVQTTGGTVNGTLKATTISAATYQNLPLASPSTTGVMKVGNGLEATDGTVSVKNYDDISFKGYPSKYATAHGKIGLWSKLVRAQGYGTALIFVRVTVLNQASHHVFCLTTSFNNAYIYQLTSGKYSNNANFQIRITQQNSETFPNSTYDVEIYEPAWDRHVDGEDKDSYISWTILDNAQNKMYLTPFAEFTEGSGNVMHSAFNVKHNADIVNAVISSPSITATTMSAGTYSNLPSATTSTLGVVKVGNGINVSNGTISLKAGTNISIGSDNSINCTADVTPDLTGVVMKTGSTMTGKLSVNNGGLDVTGDTKVNGTLSATSISSPNLSISNVSGTTVKGATISATTYSNLPLASSSSTGVMKVSSGLEVSNGAVSVSKDYSIKGKPYSSSTVSTKIGSWSKIIRMSGYGSVIFFIRDTAPSQAAHRVFLFTPSFQKCRLYQLEGDNYPSGNPRFKIRATLQSDVSNSDYDIEILENPWGSHTEGETKSPIVSWTIIGASSIEVSPFTEFTEGSGTIAVQEFESRHDIDIINARISSPTISSTTISATTYNNLPKASTTDYGIAKVGNGLSVTSDGTISVDDEQFISSNGGSINGTLSATTFSGSTVKGVNLSGTTVKGATISATTYNNLPSASTASFGVVKVGSGLSVSDGVISVDSVDDKYVNVTGDTMSGNLSITSGGLDVSGDSKVKGSLTVNGDAKANRYRFSADTTYIGASTTQVWFTLSGVSGTQSPLIVEYTTGGTLNVRRSGNGIGSATTLGTSNYRWANVYSVNGNFSGDLSVSGNVTATGAMYSSDKRLKENIGNISNEDLEKVSNVDIVKFNFKSDESKRTKYGVIAQDIENIGFSNLVGENIDGTKNVDYISLLMLEIEYLKKEIKDLKAKLG